MQQLLIQQCKERIGKQKLAPVLADLLGVNLDAAYRRMRGTTALNFDEIRKICLHFNLSFDSIINYEGKLVPFQFNAMFGTKFNILDYLKNIREELKVLTQQEDTTIVMTAMDLPYFRQFGFPALSRFKLFFWLRSVLNLEEFRHQKFDPMQGMEEYDEVVKDVYKYYHGVNSTEIWATETLDSTLKQIKYYSESGLFVSDGSVEYILEDLKQLLSKLEREAEMGKKQIQLDNEIHRSDFSMYQSDIFLSNNCIQATLMGRTYTYVSFNSFNSLMSFNRNFSEESTKWIEQIRLKSILLSEVSEKLRYQYFKVLREKVEALEKELG
jgi:hypothetical protein